MTSIFLKRFILSLDNSLLLSCVNQLLNRLHIELLKNFDSTAFAKESDISFTHSLISGTELVKFKLSAFFNIDKTTYCSDINFVLNWNNGEHLCQFYISSNSKELEFKEEKLFAHSFFKTFSKKWTDYTGRQSLTTYPMPSYHTSSRLSSNVDFINSVISGFSSVNLDVRTLDWSNFVLTEKLNTKLKSHAFSFLEIITP